LQHSFRTMDGKKHRHPFTERGISALLLPLFTSPASLHHSGVSAPLTIDLSQNPLPAEHAQVCWRLRPRFTHPRDGGGSLSPAPPVGGWEQALAHVLASPCLSYSTRLKELILNDSFTRKRDLVTPRSRRRCH
jgi:hypothetical protein